MANELNRPEFPEALLYRRQELKGWPDSRCRDTTRAMKTWVHVILPLVCLLSACFGRGCPESCFELLPDSRLPKMLEVPLGMTREQVTVRMCYYSGETVLWLYGPEGNELASVVAGKAQPHPANADNELLYGDHWIVEVAGVSDIFHHPVMAPVFRAVDAAPSSPEERMATRRFEVERMELELAAASETSVHDILLLAEMALDVANLDVAEARSRQVLAMPDIDANDVHHAHNFLGRVALRRGDKAAAVDHLYKAGDVSGSPQLNSFGPNMALAKELLEAGVRDAVLEYFNQVQRFWKDAQLEEWRKNVKRGETPDFRANLVY